MLFKVLYWSTLLAASTHAASIAKNAEDGVYRHVIDSNGKEAIEFLGHFESSNKAEIPRPFARRADKGPQGYVTCSNDVLAIDEQKIAEQGLATYCGGGKSFKGNISFKSGGAVAFICDYGKGQTCYEDQTSYYLAATDSQCGNGRAGWWSIESWKVTYGTTLAGKPFC